MTDRRIIHLNKRALLSIPTLIFIFVVCSIILSFGQITDRIRRTTDYLLNKLAIPSLNNKTNSILNINVQLAFSNPTFILNNVDLTDLSGEYEEVSSILTMNNTLHRYTVEELYFALTTNTKRIRNTIHYLKFWIKHPGIRCLIVFDEKDFMTNQNITEYLLHEEISCQIQTSNITRYEARYLDLFRLAWNNQEVDQRKTIQWFAVGDDDTVWFIDNLLHTLQQYNSSISIYLGDVSDRKSQVDRHGSYYAYGGGGILLSRPLVLSFAKDVQECQRYSHIFGGDAMIGKCITEVFKVDLTRNHHFLQMDHSGDITGYLESGINELVSLHHMFSLWKPFPDEHADKINDTMLLLQLAYTTFGKKFLKRYVRFNRKINQTLLLTMGYSFSLFNRILSHDEFHQVENTWHGTEMTARTMRSQEDNKTTWYFRRITNETFNRSIRYRQKMYNHCQTIDIIFTY